MFMVWWTEWQLSLHISRVCKLFVYYNMCPLPLTSGLSLPYQKEVNVPAFPCWTLSEELKGWTPLILPSHSSWSEWWLHLPVLCWMNCQPCLECPRSSPKSFQIAPQFLAGAIEAAEEVARGNKTSAGGCKWSAVQAAGDGHLHASFRIRRTSDMEGRSSGSTRVHSNTICAQKLTSCLSTGIDP